MNAKSKAMEEVSNNLVKWSGEDHYYTIQGIVQSALAAIAMPNDEAWRDPKDPPKGNKMVIVSVTGNDDYPEDHTCEAYYDKGLASLRPPDRQWSYSGTGLEVRGTVTGWRDLLDPRASE